MTAQQRVASYLREAILSGALVSGQRLVQDQIAARFSVSKIPVREALRMLEAEGLVTIYPHRGAVVTRLSIDELKDITEIRVALECMAIRSAIPRYQPSDFEALEALLAKMDEPTHSVQTWLELNKEFHQKLYEPSGRKVLCRYVASMRDQSDRYLRLVSSLGDLFGTSQEEHRAIVDACRRKDVSRCEVLLVKHIERSANQLMQYLDQIGYDPGFLSPGEAEPM